MKKIITLLALVSVSLLSAQAYKGAGDLKLDVGTSLQKDGRAIRAAADLGFAQNISFGFAASYILNSDINILGAEPKFADRIDAKIRLNANIGDVLKLDSKLDVYPGLNFSFKNLGAHLGARYFFTDGFGVHAETGFPIAKYNNNPVGFEYFNNQFTLNFGITFNM